MKYAEIDEKLMQSFEYETTVQSEINGSILGVCKLGKAEIQLINDENNYSSYKGSWIKTYHGSFYIYDVAPVQEKVNIKLSCYDIKCKLDKPYDSTKHHFPCTLKEWRNSIFDDCGVEYDNSDFPNSNLTLETEPYIGENPSNRTAISLIAQAGASIVITDNQDCFYFDWFSNETHIAEDWSSLTTEKESSKPINCIVLGRGDTEDNVFYPENKPANPIEFRIDNNYILDPQDTSTDEDRRYITRVPVYNRVNGFKYLIFDIRSTAISNKLSIKLGQKIKYIDIWGNELEAYIMTKKIIWIGGDLKEDDNYEIELSAKELKETSTDLSYASSIQNDILRVERKADKNAGKIEDLVSEVTETTEKTNILEITVDGTKQIVSSIESNLNNTEKNITQIKNSVENLTTATEQQINIINETIENGVSKVVTTSSTFDENGLSMEKSGEQMSSKLDWDGFDVTRDKGKATETNMLSVRSDGVNAENVTVRAYLTQRPIRREKGISMSDGVSVGLCEYWVGE